MWLQHVIRREDFEELTEFPKKFRDRVMLRLLWALGLRTGELIRIRIEDVDARALVTALLSSREK